MASPALLDADWVALLELLGRDASLHDAAAGFGRLLAGSRSPGRLLVALRILLQDGLLRSVTEQVQALFLLHSADPAGGQQLLVQAAAAEAAPLAVRLLALQALSSSSGADGAARLTARQFEQECDSAALQGSPTLSELQRAYVGNGLESPPSCSGAAAGPAALPPLPAGQMLALDLLEAWAGRSDLGAGARQQARALRAALGLLLTLEQVECLQPSPYPTASQPADSSQLAAGGYCEVAEDASPTMCNGTQRSSGGDSPVDLSSHHLVSLPCSPQALPTAAPPVAAADDGKPQKQAGPNGIALGSPLQPPQSPNPQGQCLSGLELAAALEQAQHQPLVPASQQQLLAALRSSCLGEGTCPSSRGGSSSSGKAAAQAVAGIGGLDSETLLETWASIDAAQFASLVQHNPLVAAEVISTACRLQAAGDEAVGSEAAAAGSSSGGGPWGKLAAGFMAACCLAPTSTQSIECMSVLVSSSSSPPPDEVLHTFVNRCMGSIDAMQDPGRRGRLVQLLCAFVGHLVQWRPSSVLGMHEELAAFCIQYSRAKQAADLFGRLQLLASKDAAAHALC